MSQIAVRCSKISKRFNLKKSYSSGLFGSLHTSNSSKFFWALKEIDFDLRKGDSLGIIGANGAGKSTLLKLLSRITYPTAGTIELEGSVSSLLEVGTGFHSELTGLENIYLNGTILGMKRREIKERLDQIISFSGVEDFIKVPVKHFSSGMKVRLAFSVAAHLDPDILIIDEVLAVGDAEFQKKSIGKMESVTDSGRTVLFVSHNLGLVKQLCNHCIYLKNGEIKCYGPTKEAINLYVKEFDESIGYIKTSMDKSKPFNITKVEVRNSKNEIMNNFPHNDEIEIMIYYHSFKECPNTYICVSVYNQYKLPIFTSDIELDGYFIGDKKINRSKMIIPANVLKSGNYSILAAIHDPTPGVGAFEFLQYICPFTVLDAGSDFSKYEGRWETGDVFVNCKWEFEVV